MFWRHTQFAFVDLNVVFACGVCWLGNRKDTWPIIIQQSRVLYLWPVWGILPWPWHDMSKLKKSSVYVYVTVCVWLCVRACISWMSLLHGNHMFCLLSDVCRTVTAVSELLSCGRKSGKTVSLLHMNTIIIVHLLYYFCNSSWTKAVWSCAFCWRSVAVQCILCTT